MIRLESPGDSGSAQSQQVEDGPFRPVFVPLGHFFFAYRDYLFPFTFFILLLTTRPALLFGSEYGDWWLDLIGVLTCCLGQSCRFLVAGYVNNIRRRGYKRQIGAELLIQSGIFAHVRNPLYVGNLLIVSGFALISNNLWWYLVVLPSFGFVYYAIVIAEEAYLTQTFGAEYVDYCRRVHRFVPRLSGLRQNLMPGFFDWRHALRREYGTICSWGSMTFVLLIWERWKQFGYAARAGEINELFVGLLFLLLVYYAVRQWKQNGRLSSD